MAAITPFKIIPFGSTGGGTGQFGSGNGANGNYGGTISTDPAVIQGLSAWLQGYANLANTDANGLPYAEDHTGIWYVVTKALELIQTSGIGEYIATVNYRLGAIVCAASTSQLYISKKVDNIGNALTDTTSWISVGDLANLKAVALTGAYSDLSGKPNLATVAISGAYGDLSGKPTNVSSFINDAGYLTSQTQNVPYTVSSAKTDSNGYASFITKINNSTIGFDTNSGSTPIKICYSDGTIETNNTLPNITNILTNATHYVVKEKGGNPYISSLPIEQFTAPVSPINGQLWLDISAVPHIPKKWNGSSWIITQFVKLGEFIRTSEIIGTPISYALNGIYISPVTIFYGNLFNTITISTNLGYQFQDVRCFVRKNSSDNSYPWSSNAYQYIAGNGSSYGQIVNIISNNAIQFKTSNLVFTDFQWYFGVTNGNAVNGEFYIIAKRIFSL